MSSDAHGPLAPRRIYSTVALGITAALCVVGVTQHAALLQPSPEALASIPRWEEVVGEIPSERDNAAVLYEQAFALISVPRWYRHTIWRTILSDGPVDAPPLARFEAVCAENAEALRLLHEAGERPGCVYPLVPHDCYAYHARLGSHYEAVLLAISHAFVLAQRGAMDAAFAALADALRCCRGGFSGMPSVSTFVAETTEIKMICRAARALLGDCRLDGADTGAFETEMDRTHLQADLLRALRAESAWGVALYDTALGWGNDRLAAICQDTTADWPQAPDIYLQVNRSVYIEEMAATIRRASHPYRAVASVVEDYPQVPRWARHTAARLPSQRLMLVSRDGALAWQRMCLIALEVAKRGEAPRVLQDLLPALDEAHLEDVFSGRTFQYARTPDGFVLYSVGSDLDDDGGRAQRRLGGVAHYDGDLVWSSGQ